MANDFFNDEDDFRDNTVEMENGQWQDVQASAPPRLTQSQTKALQQAKTFAQSKPMEQPRAEVVDIPQIVVDDDSEEDYSAVLMDARLRLEQGRLYEMIMNHELFDGTNADPMAVRHVQKQIRRFAKEQMEIMLGMRRETTKVEHLEIDFPFNSVEVNVLKKLAFAASKGASENSDRFVPAVTKTTAELPNFPRREGLNPIKPAGIPAMKTVQQKPVAHEVQKAVPKETKKIPPLPRKMKALVDKLTPEEQALLELDYKPLEKSPLEMTEQERLERFQESRKRQANKKSTRPKNALPPLTPDQEEVLFKQQVVENSGTGTVSAIMTLLNNQAKKK